MADSSRALLRKRAARPLRITRFEVRGFRSCRYAVLLPEPDLTALVGVNGSGKSNLLQAVLLLSQLARGRFGRGEATRAIPCQIRVEFDFRGRRILYESRMGLSSESISREEIEGATEIWNFKSLTGQDRPVLLPMSYFVSPSVSARWMAVSKQQHFLLRARAQMRVRGYAMPDALLPRSKGGARIYECVRTIGEFCRGIQYYSASRFTNPANCPSSIEIEADGRLVHQYSSGTLAEFLYDLYRSRVSDERLYQQYISIVGRTGIGLLDRINWKAIKAPARDVRVRPGGTVVRERKDRSIVIPTMVVRGFRLAPGQLSEGTFRSLALIFNLLSAKSDLLLLEEPEVCVHHGLLSSIVEIIKSCASRKQVIFSTHSDFVLDALEPNKVQVVRYSTNSGTRVNKLPETMSARDFKGLKTYLQESGNLGEYWRHKGFM